MPHYNREINDWQGEVDQKGAIVRADSHQRGVLDRVEMDFLQGPIGQEINGVDCNAAAIGVRALFDPVEIGVDKVMHCNAIPLSVKSSVDVNLPGVPRLTPFKHVSVRREVYPDLVHPHPVFVLCLERCHRVVKDVEICLGRLFLAASTAVQVPQKVAVHHSEKLAALLGKMRVFSHFHKLLGQTAKHVREELASDSLLKLEIVLVGSPTRRDWLLIAAIGRY